MSFIFGGNTGMSYDDIQRKRTLADAMAASIGAPRNAGEGLTALGRAFAYRGLNKRADAADKENRGAFDDKWASLFGGPASKAPSTPGFAPSSVAGGDRDLLAKTLMAEAGGEGLEGMLAAGSVINNRVKAGGYGDGLSGVIMKPGQFSAWNGVTGYAGGEGALDMANMRPSEDAYRAADMLLSGQYQDQTGGATHYYNPAVANPRWGQRAGGEWKTIGNHVFGFGDGRPGADGTNPSGARFADMNPQLLAELAASPYANAGQKTMAQVLLQQQMRLSDPAAQLDLKIKQAQLEKMQEPGPTGYIVSGKKAQELGLDPAVSYNIAIDGGVMRATQIGGGGTTVTVGGSKLETEYDKTRGKAYGELANNLQDQGRTATRTLTALDAMERSAGGEGFYSGLGSGGVQFAKRAAKALGLDANGIKDMEAFNAISKQAALDVMGGSLGTGFSNADRDFVLDQVPTLSNTPEGNAALIEIQRAMAERSQDLARLAREYERKHGRIDLGFEDELATFAEQNPVFTDEWWSSLQAKVSAKGTPDPDQDGWVEINGVRIRERKQ